MKFQNDKITVSSYDGGKTYEVQSNITVQAKINSSVTCRINHTELQQPITSTFQITDIVNLMPSTPEISYHKKENGNATLTCTSSGFYPGNASVVWIIYGNQIKELQTDIISKTEDGTYNVTSTINVKVKDYISGVICEIAHLTETLQSPEFYLKQDSCGPAITITGALRCIIGAVHLGVMIFLCYHEMENKRKGQKK
ncbi:signal-regulatory protein beta-1-like isoform X2 [Protopterus annectens]|uniref:signal-regulatory protein beta-1-like isoform X2 n=1 Tax=Protopterus annectens TaxID=7888 RepID=UPI001CFC27ED|nr:signal-regulatory protein beta-1-like isoform X2 [Protopterus annectens]